MKQTFTVKAMALSDPAFESLPVKRELVFPLGTPPGNDDRQWNFTAEDLAGVVSAFDQRNDKYIVVDYAHGEDKSKGDLAAGWIDGLELAADGLYARIRYTETASDEIKSGGWGYRSPTFDAQQDEAGAWHPRKLTALALTNKPAIGGMPPIQASTTTDPQPAAKDGTKEEEPTMADLTSVTAAKQKSAALDKPGVLTIVRDAFKIPDAVTDEVLAEIITKALEGDGANGPNDQNMPPMPGAEAQPADNPAELPFPLGASVKPRIELVENPKDNARIIASVQKAASLGTITPQTLEAAGKLACADIDAFERMFCEPPAPAAGQLINASAADRSPQTTAQRLTAKYQAQANRPHFTQGRN